MEGMSEGLLLLGNTLGEDVGNDVGLFDVGRMEVVYDGKILGVDEGVKLVGLLVGLKLGRVLDGV